MFDIISIVYYIHSVCDIKIVLEVVVRIKVMDQVFGISGIGNIVLEYISNPESKNVTIRDPQSKHIPVSCVVDAYYSKEKERGVLDLFWKCVTNFQLTSENKRREQYKEGALCSFTILNRVTDCVGQTHPKVCEAYKKLVATPRFEQETISDGWLESQRFTLQQIVQLCDTPQAIKEMNKKVRGYAEEYVQKNGLTRIDGTTTYSHKTLHGKPFDQNRLGKVEGKDFPGFEGFYIAGSEVKLPLRTYDIMQAPLVASADKDDTVQDFWDTVVALRKSPIIVTTHDPKEKIPKYGKMQRAKYWTSDRFPMELKNGWRLNKAAEDVVLATSRHSNDIKLVKRQFVAEQCDTKVQHQVTQFHYKGWPDHLGAPDLELLEIANNAVEEEFAVRGLDKEAPVTVHCAAGMGRSPLFVAANHLMLEVSEGLEKMQKVDEIACNIPALIFEMKKQRPSMLGGDDHWECLFRVMKRVYLRHSGAATQELYLCEDEQDRSTIAKGLEGLKKDAEAFKNK